MNTVALRLGLTLVALLACAAFLGLRSMPESPALTHDSANFLSAAENLVHLNRFVYSVPNTLSTQSYEEASPYMPGYQVVLAGVLALGVSTPAALYAVTLFGLIALTALTFLTAWQLTRSTLAAGIAAVWVLTMPQILDVMTHALTESLYLPLTMAAILLAVIYLQQTTDHPHRYLLLGAMAFVMSWAPMMRAFGLALVPAICGTMMLRSLLHRRWKSLLLEAGVGVVAVLPTAANMLASYILNGCAYCGTTPERVDLSTVAVTRGWIASLMAGNFLPDVNLGIGLRQLVRNPFILAALGLVVVSLTVALVVSLRSHRAGLRSVISATVGWPRLPIYIYVALYLIFIFGTSTPGVYVAFNYPRYLVPIYPFFILLVVTLVADLYREAPAAVLRVALAAVVLLYGLGVAQAANAFVATAQGGRGLEAPTVREHPVFAFLGRTLREEDVVFSTKAPTVWYYTRRPVHRLDGVERLNCAQLVSPVRPGRSVFVLFPFYVFKGNPSDPENATWFENWAGQCGRVASVDTFQDAVVFIVEPKG